MPKGKKTCPNCSFQTGPRAFACPKCNSQFVFKAKSKEEKNTKIVHHVNWSELVKGDRIKVRGGPFFMHKGEFVPMGYRGKFVVESVDDKGILAWGIDKNAGFAHIYMGPDFRSPETGIYKTKHKILKLKRKDQKDITRELV